MDTFFTNKIPAIIAAACSIFLGGVVLIGWYSHTYELIQILPQFAPMQYNTALCFLLCGVCLFATAQGFKKLGFVSGLFVSVISTVTLFQYATDLNLGIDQFMMDAYLTVKTAYPGRMSVITASGFFLISTSLTLALLAKKQIVVYAYIEALALIVLALSILAMFGYLLSNSSGNVWDTLTLMALHTASGFFVLSFGILLAVWNRTEQHFASVPMWTPFLLFFIIFTIDLMLPRGVAFGVAYVPLIFYSVYFYSKKATILFAALATMLTLVGYLLSVDSTAVQIHVLINRGLSVVAIWITAIVIYQQKITQEKLLKSEEALALGWRGAGDGMWDWDVLTNVVVFSDRFKALLGYQPDEIPDHFDEWANRLHEEDKEKTLQAVSDHIEKQTEYSIEYRLMTKSGQWRWYLAKGQALWDEKGSPIRMAGSLSDITKRKETEIELRLLKLAVDNSKDVVLITEANIDSPEIVFVNKASEELCGYTPEEMIGKTPRFLQGEATDKTQLAALKEALRNNQPFSTELINYAKDGREYWIDINIVPVINEQGVTTHFAAIERDITFNKLSELERDYLIKALEKSNKDLEKSNQDLDEFAYIASHDLKAPLRVIDNTSMWLEEDLGDKLDDESRENLQLLRGRVIRMERLLDDLLEYSRIGRTADENDKGLVTGEELLTDICELLPDTERFKIVASSEFLQLKVNKMPLLLIFRNLVSNAIKHHDKKVGNVELSVKITESEYIFYVKDDGAGIPAKFHKQIFKMFQTLKPRDQVEGSGMGLAVVRKHIEHFGGKINVESRENKGCTFYFTWPRNQT